MKLLKDLLYKAGLQELIGSTNVAISQIVLDSRKAVKDSLFVAVRGSLVDGHDYIEMAINKGALAIVCEEIPTKTQEGIIYVKVENSLKALSFIAANFYDNPSAKLKLVGITGTNGKTTVATLLFNLFRNMGMRVGLLSTVNCRINSEIIPATHTTPDPISLNALLAEMVIEGCKYCFMEVSSHGIAQHRTLTLDFDGGVFTNISHDHLDYHKTFDAYINTKKAFFDGLKPEAFALVNSDDKHGETMCYHTKAKKMSYALKRMADFKCRILENQFTGLQINVDGQDVWTRLVGSFNAYNLTAVYGTAVMLGLDKMQALTALSALNSVEGRFQYIKSESNITAVVDYAHTPDALKNVLQTIADIRTGNEQVIAVVGCGGDRDKTKRPLMAGIAAQFSNKVVLTSDNPRSEDPAQIIEDMKLGLAVLDKPKVLSITDRAEAIRTACAIAQPGDIVLVAGKGHEKYQDIKGVKHPFDDFQILRETFNISLK
ncbi:MAG: UDP-N-acetylmuramoyl-L-alanyl-D-glutamate--2,6-diaminopimelate ligase [Flavobacteriales bacterium]|jgi:UDP-N-acetylmuramoyl-L-alanyl-D-glutamate--2,6-diaminopimelate ligase